MEKLKIYQYLNTKDSNLGTLVIVISNSKENAITLITNELEQMDYVFDPMVEIIELEIVNGLVIHTESGDCYY